MSVFPNQLLTVSEMYQSDELSIQGGIAGVDLMEAAGSTITRIIMDRWKPRPVIVLCGLGNNGGDGFVVARLLSENGWSVRLGLLGTLSTLSGDAAFCARLWHGKIEEISIDILEGQPLIIDALFGAGLSRPIEGDVASIIDTINQREFDCVSVDIPSGIDGDTGQVLGIAITAQVTVTFFRAKPGHFLYPGRQIRGKLIVTDIGIPDQVLSTVKPQIFHNSPELWSDIFPWPQITGHKYSRGHALIVGGTSMSGAGCLAARGARRAGAGLVTITVPVSLDETVATAFASTLVFSHDSPGNIVMPAHGLEGFKDILVDPRKNALLIGPGAGITEQTRKYVLTALEYEKFVVLDADALSVFESRPEGLFEAIKEAKNANVILTPHEGEFKRLFALEGSKLQRAIAAARISGAAVLLKGPDTVIASPDGRAVINSTGNGWLATAGSGDVLAGFITGMVAQGVPVFEAGCIAAWLHGRAAEQFGPGLIAEDLPEQLPKLFRYLEDEILSVRQN